MDYSKVAVISPILVAVITVVGTLAPSLLSNVAIQTSNKPNIVLEKQDVNNDKTMSLIKVKNTGSAPASNLTLLIDSTNNIDSVTRVLSFVNLSLPSVSGDYILQLNKPVLIKRTSLEVNAEKLIQGGGDQIELLLKFGGVQESEKYRAFVIYDQGSSVANTNTFFSMSNPTFLTIYVLLYIASAGYFLYYFYAVRRRRFIQGLIQNLTNIRRTLIDNPDNGKYIPKVWIYERNRYRKYIKDVKDFIKIDDLNTKIELRENIGRSQLAELNELNRDSLRMVNDILQNIDWKKYT